MNWTAITHRIVREFQLKGCFLLNKDRHVWVGDKPTSTFRSYLSDLFTSKPTTYFNEIRFFKYSESNKKKDMNPVSKYLALIPIDLKEFDFQFLGIIYENPNQLQELLKFRILPMYLVFFLHQFLVESRIRRSGEEKQSQLLTALEEKRIYAQQLEHKVKSLHEEIENIKNSEMGLDQKVAELSRLLDRQSQEYQNFATAYQELFTEFQDVQNEFLTTSITLEHKILDLEVEKRRLKMALRKQAREAGEKDEKGVTQKEYMELGIRLKKALHVAAKYTRLYEDIKAEIGDLDPGMVKQLVATLGVLKDKVEYYRGRCLQQEAALKNYHNKEIMG